MTHAAYLDDIDPSDEEIYEELEWMDNEDEDEYPEGERLSELYFEM